MTAGPIPKNARWQADRQHFDAAVFDDTSFIYVKSSGDSHFLSFLPYDALMLLCDTPMTLSTLHEKLLSEYGFSTSELTLGLVQKALDELDDIGLVKPLSGTLDEGHC